MRRMFFSTYVSLAAVLSLVLATGQTLNAQERSEGFGPFPTRNHSPIQLLFLGMPAEQATTLRTGSTRFRLEVAEASTIFDERRRNSRSLVKMEQRRTALELQYGLSDRFQVGFEIPVIHRVEGFLDGFIEFVESFTVNGLVRDRLEDVPFAFEMERNGETLFRGQDGQIGLGDVPLFAKYNILPEGDRVPATSLRAAVKFPTGASSRAFGSGTVDVGIGLAAQKHLFPWWIMYANVNGVFPTARVNGLETLPVFSAVLGNEFIVHEKFTAGIQFDSYSSAVTGSGLRSIDKGANEVAAGFTYAFRKNLRGQVYGIEGINSPEGGEADFTLSFALTYVLGT